MNEEHNRTARFKALAPGLAWLPRFIRDGLTPMLVGSAVTFIFSALAYFFNSPQKDIAGLQKSITELKTTVDKVLTLANQNDKSQGEMSVQMTELTKTVDHQQERWERIDSVAELPPHARRHK